MTAPTYDDSRAKIALWNDPPGPDFALLGAVCGRTPLALILFY